VLQGFYTLGERTVNRARPSVAGARRFVSARRRRHRDRLRDRTGAADVAGACVGRGGGLRLGSHGLDAPAASRAPFSRRLQDRRLYGLGRRGLRRSALLHRDHGNLFSAAFVRNEQLAVGFGRGERAAILDLRLQPLLGAGDRVALLVEELLDAPDDPELFLGVDALSRLALARSESFELGLPVAQDVRLDVDGAAGFADAVVELLRNGGSPLRTETASRPAALL
jgi:hypothetical protein